MSNDINEMVILGLAEEERITVRNGSPLIKSIVLLGKDGKKLPALATVYNRPGQGVYRKQTYGVVVIPMLPDTVRKFAKALLEQADKIDDANLDAEDAKEVSEVNGD